MGNFEALLKVIKMLPTGEEVCSGFTSVFDRMQQHNQFFTSQSLLLAFEVKRLMEEETSRSLISLYELLKQRFPKCVREIIWNGKVHLINAKFGDYLYADSRKFEKNDKNRYVFTWIDSKFKGDGTSTWTFETTDGQTFYIKNKNYNNEYLFAGKDNADDARKYVFTWTPGGRNYSEAKWKVEIVDENQIIIRNIHHSDQHLYAAVYKYNDQRRYVYTYILNDEAHIKPWQSGLWNVTKA